MWITIQCHFQTVQDFNISFQTNRHDIRIFIDDLQVSWMSRPPYTIQIEIEIILLHYNVLHSQTEFDLSYGSPQ